MSTTLSRMAAVLAALAAASAAPSEAVQGYVEIPYTPTTCLQGSHFLTDPCTGTLTLVDDFRAIDLDPYVCHHVVVDGPNVGVECQVISSQSVTETHASCPIQFQGLWLTAQTPPQVNWLHVTCADLHDVVRGDLSRLRGLPGSIDLGAVRCLANDVPQESWWFVSGPTDADTPPSGEAFFYVARAVGLPFGDMTYGYSSDGRERVPASGDCLP